MDEIHARQRHWCPTCKRHVELWECAHESHSGILYHRPCSTDVTHEPPS